MIGKKKSSQMRRVSAWLVSFISFPPISVSPREAATVPGNTAARFAWKLKWFALVVGGLYSGYQVTNRWPWREPTVLPLTPLDQAIPMIEWTVWPYLLLAGCIFLPLLLKEQRTFRRSMIALLFGYSLNLIIFAIWPSSFPRETISTGPHQTAFAWLYQIDTPANCFPSGHITAPLIAFHALASENRKWRWYLWLIFALLSPTILLTKQHFVLDLAGGLATGMLGVMLSGIWIRHRQTTSSQTPPRMAVVNQGLLNLWKFNRDPLGFLEKLTRDHGGVVKCRFGWLTRVIINDAYAARAILKLPHQSLNKNTRSTAMISLIGGHSLLTANGEEWHIRRKLEQPAFHHAQVEGYAKAFERLTADLITEWKAAPGRRLEIGGAMRRLTFRFICRALLSIDASLETGALQVSIKYLLDAGWQAIRSPTHWRLRLPTPARRRFSESLIHVRCFIREQIIARRRSGESADDLLALLINARDAAGCKVLTDEEIINECITLIIAGFDTTANALTWALVLLSQNEAAAKCLRAEAGGTNRERPYARAVFLETLRLYPPIWIIERNLDVTLQVEAWQLSAGDQVIISPWVFQRSSEHWENPAAFRPDRFLDAGADHAAFMPFGDGPRSCIGRGFAMLEGITLLSVVGKAGPLRLLGDFPRPEPGIALRPEGEIWMSLSAT